MGATYTRQSSSAIVDGGVIEAADINAEFDQILAAFAVTSGHTHDGTAAEGGPITKLLGTAITIGDATAGTDIAVTFDGESNDGVVTWMEDEDYFQFSDDLLLTTTEKLQFRDTAIYINSSADGQLDLVADTEIQIAATTIDINGLVDISGNLSVGGNLDVTGSFDMSDANITNIGSIALDTITNDGTDITLDSSGDIILDADGADVFLKDAGTTYGSLTNSSGNLIIKSGTTTAATFSGANVTLAGTVDSGAITSTGIVTGTGFTAGSAVLAEAELELLDGLTAGTAIASKVVTTDANIDTTGQRNLTITGELDAATGDFSGDVDIDGTLEADAITVDGTTLAEFISDTTGAMFSSNTETGITAIYQDSDNTIDLALAAAQTTITSLLATDIKIGEDNETKIDFETADEIHFYAANVEQVYIGDNIFGPQTDSDVDLGSTGVRWKDAFVDSLTTTGDLTIGGNFTVNGTTTTVATTNMVVADNLIELNNGASSNSNDSGIVIERGSTGDNAIFAWDESADTFVLGTTTATGSSTGNLTIADGALQAGSLDISGNIDIDGTSNLDVVDIDGAVDMASTLQVDGAITSSSGATITVSDNSAALELISTDADASVGPRLSLYRNSASPADDDILGDIRFMGEDDASAKLEYAKIEAQALDVSDGSIDTQLRFQIRHAGSGNDILKLTPTEAVFNEGSFDTDFRVESNSQSSAFFIDAGNGTFDFNIPGTITVNNNSDTLTLKSTDADANVGPILALTRDSSSPADDDIIGRIEFRGDDDGGNITNFLSVDTRIADATNGSEDFKTVFSGVVAGTERHVFTLGSTEAVFNDGSQDIDFRVESDNDSVAFFVQGSDGFVGLGTGTPSQLLHLSSTTNAKPTMLIETVNAGANGGRLDFLHKSSSPADGDLLGDITFGGYSDDGTPPSDFARYVMIKAFASDVSNNAEKGKLVFSLHDGASNENNVDVLTIDGQAVSTSSTLAVGGIASFSKAANVAQVALSSSSNAVAWDASAAANAFHVTTENTTFSAPSNAVEGAFICLEINYNGSHTIAFNTVFEFAASTAPTTTDTDGKTDILVFRYNGAVWQEVGRTLNLSES